MYQNECIFYEMLKFVFVLLKRLTIVPFFSLILAHDNQGGCWLLRKAEFNVGSHVNSMFRLKCRVADPTLDKRSALADKRHVTYCSKFCLLEMEWNF